MQLFHATDIIGDIATIRDQEAKHLTVVLRKKSGDLIQFTNGQGSLYAGRIKEVSKKKVTISIEKTAEHKPSSRLHLAIAPTKNTNRMEWLIEKACEIGMQEFTPLLCQRSERKLCKLEKLEKKAASACLQSLKYWFPKMNPMCPFDRFLDSVEAELKFIAYCGEDNLPLLTKSLAKSLDKCQAMDQKADQTADLEQNSEAHPSVCLLIGPEGDFTPVEFEKAIAKGFKGISFGKTRLRTETAGLMACAVVQQAAEE